MKKINLKEILDSKIPDELWFEGFSFEDVEEEWILAAMKEACQKTLELATENAKMQGGNCYGENGELYASFPLKIDNQSILSTINQVKDGSK